MCHSSLDLVGFGEASASYDRTWHLSLDLMVVRRTLAAMDNISQHSLDPMAVAQTSAASSSTWNDRMAAVAEGQVISGRLLRGSLEAKERTAVAPESTSRDRMHTVGRDSASPMVC